MSTKINRRNFLKLSAAATVGLIISNRANQTQAAYPPAEKNSTSTYHEAPSLHQQVLAGTLPPVDQRLPKVPLTLSPIDAIGIYGGRLRTFWSGGWSGYWQESQYGHSPLRWIDDGMGIAPGMCDTWSANADNSVWTLHVREGLKWSDGQPCTVDDVMFWWHDLTQATDGGNPDPVPDFGTDANGNLATFAKVDDYTLTISYGTPAPLTAKRLAMWVNANIGPRWIAPMHYLKQFLPKYNLAETDFQDFNNKATTWSNPDCPVLNAWILTKYVADNSMTGERNPYYYTVDPMGNQLPYIDGQDWINISNGDPAVEILKISQGFIDFQHFHNYGLPDISTLTLNQNAGNYDVYLWDSGSGTGMVYFWNFDYPDTTAANSLVHDTYRDPAFKQAMSFALDRPTIQESIYYGSGMITTGTMSPKAYEFNFNADAQAYGKKARDLYSAYDPKKAKDLLDNAGYKVGSGGWRTFPDGSLMEIRIDLSTGSGKECLDVLAIAKQNWEDVGLNIIYNQITPDAFTNLWQSGLGQIRTNWEVGDGPDHLLYPSWLVPNEPSRWAPLCGRLLQVAGTPLENTETNLSPWDRHPPRFNKNDPEYKGSDVETIHGLYAQAVLEPDATKRANLVYQMWDIHENKGPFFIGTVANYPQPVIVSRKLTNVPTHDQLTLGGFVNPWILPYPAITNPETYSYKPQVYLPTVIK